MGCRDLLRASDEQLTMNKWGPAEPKKKFITIYFKAVKTIFLIGFQLY